MQAASGQEAHCARGGPAVGVAVPPATSRCSRLARHRLGELRRQRAAGHRRRRQPRASTTPRRRTPAWARVRTTTAARSSTSVERPRPRRPRIGVSPHSGVVDLGVTADASASFDNDGVAPIATYTLRLRRRHGGGRPAGRRDGHPPVHAAPATYTVDRDGHGHRRAVVDRDGRPCTVTRRPARRPPCAVTPASGPVAARGDRRRVGVDRHRRRRRSPATASTSATAPTPSGRRAGATADAHLHRPRARTPSRSPSTDTAGQTSQRDRDR